MTFPDAAGAGGSPDRAPAPAAREDLSWQDSALCAEVGAGFWHLEKGESARPAKLICSRCPVRTPCLDYALEHGERFGIYGGLTERERRLIRRRAA